MAKRTKGAPLEVPKKGGGRKTKTVEDLKQDIATKRLSIKSIFESGSLTSLRELESLFTKAMANEMGVSHTNFSGKFKNPVEFSLKELYRFAYYIGIDQKLISDQADKEISANRTLVADLKKFRSVQDMKQYNSK